MLAFAFLYDGVRQERRVRSQYGPGQLSGGTVEYVPTDKQHDSGHHRDRIMLVEKENCCAQYTHHAQPGHEIGATSPLDEVRYQSPAQRMYDIPVRAYSISEVQNT